MSPNQSNVATDRFEASDDLLDSASALEGLSPEKLADQVFARFDQFERSRFVAQMALRQRMVAGGAA